VEKKKTVVAVATALVAVTEILMQGFGSYVVFVAA
jgi:hypothetical protein